MVVKGLTTRPYLVQIFVNGCCNFILKVFGQLKEFPQLCASELKSLGLSTWECSFGPLDGRLETKQNFTIIISMNQISQIPRTDGLTHKVAVRV